MKEHPMLAVDTSTFTKEFNLSALLAKVALGVASALVIRYTIKKIDSFMGVKGK